MKLTVLLIVFTFLYGGASADTLKPFTGDGCSSFPNGTFEQKD